MIMDKLIYVKHSITKKDELFNYTIVFDENLGRGGYGTVFHGILTDHNDYDRKIQVALKKTNWIDYNEIKILMYLRKHLGNRKDINYYIDNVYDSNERCLYLITKYIPNQISMNNILLNRFSIYEIVIIMLNVCIALQYVHSLNISHTDIKPSNIMINPHTLEIRLIDFGLSCMLPVCKQIIGTLSFLAPEIYIINGDNKDKFNKKNMLKADIFSLGATFYSQLNSGNSVYDFYEDCKSIVSNNDYNECIIKNLKLKKQFLLNFVDKDITDIINEMIQIEPDNRPTIDTIVNKLTTILNKYKSSPIENISIDKELQELLNEKVL